MKWLGLFTSGLIVSACGSSVVKESKVNILGGQDVTDSINDARRLSTVALTTDLPSSKDPSKGPLIDQGHSFCTGTLIGTRTVITAAHCLQDFDPATRSKKPGLIFPKESNFLIHFGNKVSRNNVVIPAAKVIPHPDWSPADTLSPLPLKAANDIGIIILSSDAPTSHVPVDLASENLKLNGLEAILAGFGVTKSRNNNDTGTLRWVSVKFSGDNARISRVQVNGGFGKGACAGDSGGPAYVKSGNQLLLVGATSTGMEIAGNCIGLQNNYTDARRYVSWIRSIN
jgi:hypothetical protein